jgi:hypothetical protein
MAEDGGRMTDDQWAGREPVVDPLSSVVQPPPSVVRAPSFVLRADHVVGGGAIAAALAVLAVSGDLPFGTLAFPGSGMMPKLLCGLMIVLGAMLFARAGTSAPFSEIGWRDLPHGVRVLAITAAAVAFYTTLGFIVAMALLLFALTVLERRNLLAAALYSVGVSLGTYALFVFLLKSPLDQGIFGF